MPSADPPKDSPTVNGAMSDYGYAMLRFRPKAKLPRWTLHFHSARRIIDFVQTGDIDYALQLGRRRHNGVAGVSTFDRDYVPPTEICNAR